MGRGEYRIRHEVGSAIEDNEIVEGFVLKTENKVADCKISKSFEAKNILLGQFHLSPPKTNLDYKIVIDDPKLMDEILTQEKDHIEHMCKKIKEANIDLLIIQKSIVREACNELSHYYLKKLGITTIEVSRDEMEYLSSVLEVEPCADIDTVSDFIYNGEVSFNRKIDF